MTDLTNFKPATVQDLMSVLESQAAQITGAWWKTNAASVEAYLKSLASAGIQTTEALATRQIDQETATQLLQAQANTLKLTLTFAVYMSEALAQELVDTFSSTIAWAVFNRTGINILPTVVKPVTP